MALRKKIAAGLLVAATMSVAAMLNQESGDLTPEKVVAEQPEVIIATGGSWAKDPKQPEVLPHVELGYKSTKDIAEKTLASLLKTPGFDALEAPKDSELHTVSRDDAHCGVLARGHIFSLRRDYRFHRLGRPACRTNASGGGGAALLRSCINGCRCHAHGSCSCGVDYGYARHRGATGHHHLFGRRAVLPGSAVFPSTGGVGPMNETLATQRNTDGL